MRRLVLRLLVNAVGLYIAVQLLQPGLRASGGWLSYVIVALILGLVNALVRPILALITSPIIILTLGLFTLVINALMLWLAGAISSAVGVSFEVQGFVPAFLGALVLSVVNWVFSWFIGDLRRR